MKKIIKALGPDRYGEVPRYTRDPKREAKVGTVILGAFTVAAIALPGGGKEKANQLHNRSTSDEPPKPLTQPPTEAAPTTLEDRVAATPQEVGPLPETSYEAPGTEVPPTTSAEDAVVAEVPVPPEETLEEPSGPGLAMDSQTGGALPHDTPNTGGVVAAVEEPGQ